MIYTTQPESLSYAGYSALITQYGLRIPVPVQLCGISQKHKKYKALGWNVYTPRYMPHDTLYGHLVFALRYEGLDLTVLKALFDVISAKDIQNIVINEPTGKYARRIWFLYEYLKGVQIDIENATQGTYITVLDEKLQFGAKNRASKRHRVYNNLPGVLGFCPLITKTPALLDFIEKDISGKALQATVSVDSDIVLRASAFLLLDDSKASYAIEGERPSHNRTLRWGRILGQAGQNPLSISELERLQKQVIVDDRFIKMGYRTQGGFVGDHDRQTGFPLPRHISAKHTDISDLMGSMMDTIALLKNSEYPAVLLATVIAFGFVFIHPFEDGNGRLHRYILHHILAETGVSPENIVFPVSSVILKRIGDYKKVLEQYSIPRLDFVQWHPTPTGNVDVVNDTKDLYSFFDATAQAEFIYECVMETVDDILPAQILYLQRYEHMKAYLLELFDMPDKMVDRIIRFLEQGGGVLSKRAKQKELNAFTEDELQNIENQYQYIFNI